MSNPTVAWGDGVLDAGFCQVPNLVLDHQSELGLSNDELTLVIHVLKYKHNATDPYPKNKTIADKMGTSERTLERYISSLKSKGYLERSQINEWSHSWSFAPLLRRLRDMSPGDKYDTPPGDISDTPPGDKSVTQKNTKNEKTKNEKRETARAHVREEAEPNEKPAETYLPNVVRTPANSGQVNYLRSLLKSQDIPDAQRERYEAMIEDGMQKETCSELIDELKYLPKRPKNEGRIHAKLWNGSQNYLAWMDVEEYERIQGQLAHHNRNHGPQPAIFTMEGKEVTLSAIQEFNPKTEAVAS
jgi:hypothetical protein